MTNTCFYVNIFHRLGDSMNLTIAEGYLNSIMISGSDISVATNRFSNFNSFDAKDIIKYAVYNGIFNDNIYIKELLDEDLLDSIYLYAISRMSYETLTKKFSSKNESAILYYKFISDRHNEYLKLISSKINSVNIVCDKNNFLRALVFSRNFRGLNITLSSVDISFSDFYYLLKNVNLSRYESIGLKVAIPELDDDIGLKDLYSLSCKLKEIADEINKLNLTDMEKAMYAYDLVKKRIYKESSEDTRLSRSTDKVLDGDYIVCVGYARIFNALLSFLNIDSQIVFSSKEKHARSLAYIDDKKYGITGFFVFDPTWDSKKHEEDDEYVNNYKRFAMPVIASNNRIPIEHIISIKKMSFNEFMNYYWDEKISLSERSRLYNTLLNFAKALGFDDFNVNINSVEFLNKAKMQYELIRKSLCDVMIPMPDFAKMLYNVRRCECCNGMVSTLNAKEIRDITLGRNRYISSLKSQEMTDDEFLDGLDFKLDFDSMLEERKEDLERDAYNMELIKVLKRRLTSMQK